MSYAFFQQVGLPQPNINPEAGASSHAQQTDQIMDRLELVVPDRRPDWVLVYGDVNFTRSCSLVRFVLHSIAPACWKRFDDVETVRARLKYQRLKEGWTQWDDEERWLQWN